MTLLTREHIQSNSTFEMVEVDVSEWGNIDPKTGERERTTVFVREMSARERDDYEASHLIGKGKKARTNFKDMRAKLAIATCCDADGNLIFTPHDVQWLSSKPVKVLDRICDAANKINGMRQEEDEEETLKN